MALKSLIYSLLVVVLIGLTEDPERIVYSRDPLTPRVCYGHLRGDTFHIPCGDLEN
jgi:hypothetical protein